jgi:hypothetical protein
VSECQSVSAALIDCDNKWVLQSVSVSVNKLVNVAVSERCSQSESVAVSQCNSG